MGALQARLEELKGNSRLIDCVIDYVLEGYIEPEIKNFFRDLLQHGCVSGMITSLIYYSDTAKFYDNYYNEIEELREELEESLGESIAVKGDLKDFYACLAFEETARILSENLGLDN